MIEMINTLKYWGAASLALQVPTDPRLDVGILGPRYLVATTQETGARPFTSLISMVTLAVVVFRMMGRQLGNE